MSPVTGLQCLGCASDAQPTELGIASVNAFVSAICLMAMEPRSAAQFLGRFCDKHTILGARVMAAFGEQNRIPQEELTAKLSALLGVLPSPGEAPPPTAVHAVHAPAAAPVHAPAEPVHDPPRGQD